MGLREQKKQATRDALSWAAVRLIAERGYDRVLVDDIATEAGVSPRTFNNYFSSKAEAVASRHLDRARRVADGLRERPASEPLWEAITQAALVQFRPGPEVTAHPRPEEDTWRAGLRLMLTVPAVQAEVLRASATAEDAFAVAVGERTGTDPATDLYPKLVAAAVMAVNSVVSRHFVERPRGETDIRSLLVDALEQIAAGLPEPL